MVACNVQPAFTSQPLIIQFVLRVCTVMNRPAIRHFALHAHLEHIGQLARPAISVSAVRNIQHVLGQLLLAILDFR